MDWEDFTYPRYKSPLIEAYGRRFEAVFVVLHPFIRVPDFLSWQKTHKYPDDEEIAALGVKCGWSEVLPQLGMASCAELNRTLLSSIGALSQEMSDPAGVNRLQNFLQSNAVWMPVEGRFEPLLRHDFLKIFEIYRSHRLVFVPEFPESEPVVRLSIAELREGSAPFPCAGTLAAPDASFLLTVDWDSFFTLFYGRREFLRQTARTLGLEGFFATPNTDHAWWNYSMGCATVTVSPEDWQMA